MEISNEVKMNQARAKAVNKRLKREIQSKESQIKKINNTYNEKINKAKIDNINRLTDVHNEGDKKVLEAIEIRQEKLDKAKQQIEQDQARLQNEKKSMVENNNIAIENLKMNQEVRYSNLMDNAKFAAREIDSQNNAVLKDMQETALDEQIVMNDRLALDRERIVTDNELEILGMTEDYQIEKNSREKQHELNQYLKDRQFRALTRSQERSHNIKLKERESAQTKELSENEKAHLNRMKEKEESFRANYQQLAKNHDTVINNLKTKFDKDLKNLVAEHNKKLEIMNDKTQDEFYRVETLDPVVLDYGKFYEVRMEVPEYESDNIRVTADGRKIDIQMTRRFEGEIDDIYGDRNKIRRSETYSKKVNVEDIVDKSSIATKYENGTLYYRIAKL